MSKKREITKAVITAAGYGTRFLPATKNVPKELLPLIDKPVLEYVTQECVDAGIKDIIIVTRYGNDAIEDYFDSAPELEQYLKKKGKSELYEAVRNVYEKANFIFVRQNRNLPYGSASPLMVVKSLIGRDEAFGFLFGDDVFLNAEASALGKLKELYQKVEWADAVVGGCQISGEDIKKYGVFEYEERKGQKLFKNVVEKPEKIKAKENYVKVGRFIYNSSIFDYIDLEMAKNNPRGELELTDVENQFNQDNDIIIGELDVPWYPTGQPIDMLKSTIKIALNRDDTKKEISKFINSLKT